MKRLKRVFPVIAVWCIATGSALSQGATLTIVTVDNGDMISMQKLAGFFSVAHPDIRLERVTLDENILRQKVTSDIATGGGQYDIETIGTCEAPLRAERGWLRALDDMPQSYAVDDLLPPIRAALSLEGKLYTVPFDGESSFTIYRTDLFEQARLEMPAAPGWGLSRGPPKRSMTRAMAPTASVFAANPAGARTWHC